MGIKALGASPAPWISAPSSLPSPRGGTVTKRIKAQELIISKFINQRSNATPALWLKLEAGFSRNKTAFKCRFAPCNQRNKKSDYLLCLRRAESSERLS